MIDKTYNDAEYKRAKIFAPQGFWDIPNAVRRGGCGAGKFGDLFVPDTIYLLAVTGICQIHDYQYSNGKTEKDRASADRTLRNNLFRYIDYKTTGSVLKWLRKRRALKYYYAVRAFGGPPFWNGKNK